MKKLFFLLLAGTSLHCFSQKKQDVSFNKETNILKPQKSSTNIEPTAIIINRKIIRKKKKQIKKTISLDKQTEHSSNRLVAIKTIQINKNSSNEIRMLKTNSIILKPSLKLHEIMPNAIIANKKRN